MADYSGAIAHPLMQWDNISAPTMRGTPVEPPDTGSLPRAVSQPLRKVLSLHSKHDDCWLGVWSGWGWDYRKHVPATMSADTGFREWDLFRAPLSMMDTQFFTTDLSQTAGLIWCDDPGWWITTDIDLNTTYIGGDKRLIKDVLESEALEALPARPDDDITLLSDKVNPVKANPVNDHGGVSARTKLSLLRASLWRSSTNPDQFVSTHSVWTKLRRILRGPAK